jgi:hypothetical protein
MAGNEAHHKSLKSINKTLAKIRENIDRLIGEVEKVRTAVVDAGETYDGRIFPTVKAELDRPVR